MVFVENLFNTLKKNNINFFTGVPDSLFSELCHAFQIKEKKKQSKVYFTIKMLFTNK